MKKTHKIVVMNMTRNNIFVGDLQKKVKSIGNGKDSFPVGNYKMSEISPGENLSEFWFPQQLLILSDEEIKKGDYRLDFHENGEPSSARHVTEVLGDEIYVVNGSHNTRDSVKRIIAIYPEMGNLPTLSKKFIEEWCKNTVDEVEVMYFEDSFSDFSGKSTTKIGEHLAVSVDNEIMCSFIESTKKEVESHSDQAVDIMNLEKEIENEANAQSEKIVNEYISQAYYAGFMDAAKSENVKAYWFNIFKNGK